MKSLLLAFSLLFSLSSFATTELPVCDMDFLKAPCTLSQEDAALFTLAMMMVNDEGLELFKQIADDIYVPEEEGDMSGMAFRGTVLESNEDQTNQVVELISTYQCKPDRGCKEYQWKVLMKMNEENEEIINEMIRVEL